MKRWLPAALLVSLIVAGCADDGPPNVRYGQESCARCRMIVNDDRFAAAAVTPSESLKFDDVICLVEFLEEKPDYAGKLWVRGYQSAQWHDARAAYFAYGPKLQTPMASGLAAVATQPEADALAAEWNGKTLRFAELAKFLAEKK
jgi:copper chaperone NosL